MSRPGLTIAHLTLDNLDDLPSRCRSCVLWELDMVQGSRATAPAQQKAAWVSRMLLEWGSCGRIAYVDGEPAGAVLFAPGAFVPGAERWSTAPASPDAVLISSLHVLPEHAGAGIGRALVRAVAEDCVRRGGFAAVEAFADSRGTQACLVPVDFYLRVGFRTHRAHVTTPRMRLDLDAVVRWRDEIEAVVERLLGAVRRPVPSVEPGSG